MKPAHVRSILTAYAIVAIVLFLGPASTRAELPPLLPRALFFGNPEKAGAQISPDGTQLSYLAPSGQGVLNVWARTVGKSDDRMVTNDTKRGIRTHFWSRDSKHLMYMQDVGGKPDASSPRSLIGISTRGATICGSSRIGGQRASTTTGSSGPAASAPDA